MDTGSTGLRQSGSALETAANRAAGGGCRIALAPGLLGERMVATACHDLASTVAWASGRAAIVLCEGIGTRRVEKDSTGTIKERDYLTGERPDGAGEATVPPLKPFSALLWQADVKSEELAVLLRKRRLRGNGFAVDSIPGKATLVRARNFDDFLAGLYWLIESIRLCPDDLFLLSTRKKPAFEHRVCAVDTEDIQRHGGTEEPWVLRAFADGYSFGYRNPNLLPLRTLSTGGANETRMHGAQLRVDRRPAYCKSIQDNEYDKYKVRSAGETLTVLPCTVGLVPRSWHVNPAFEGWGNRLIGEIHLHRPEEGGGTLPAWMGRELADAFRMLNACGAAGAWVWSDRAGAGDGSRRHSSDTLWNDANRFLVHCLLWQPNADPDAIARRWATIRFGPRAANDMAELLALSETTMEGFRHFGCESARGQCPPSSPENGPIPLDDYSRLMRVYSQFRDRVDAMIDRKREAVGLVDRMIGLVEKNRESIAAWKPPPRLALEIEWPDGARLVETVLASLRTYRHLVAAERDLVAAVFQFLQRLEDPSTGPSALSVLQEIDAFKRDWSLYLESADTFPKAGALYSSSGIQEALDCVRLDMNQETIPSFEWWVCGPLPNWNNEGYDHPFPPERRVVLSERFFSDGQEWAWSRLPDFALRDGVVDFGTLYGGREWATAYAYTEIECEKTLPAELRVGSDDGIKVWINGELVHANDAGRPVRLDDDIQPTALPKGINRILVKNTNRILGWGFCLRFTDETGRTLTEARPRLHLDSTIS